MNLLPSENIEYESKLSTEEIRERLEEFIEPPKTLRFGVFNDTETKKYEGICNHNSFDIKRIPSFSHSFLPRIRGTINKNRRNTKIFVKMRLQLFTLIFLIIWNIGIGLGFIIFLAILIENKEFNILILIPPGMLLCAYLIMLFGFKSESSRSIKDLEKLLEGKIINR